MFGKAKIAGVLASVAALAIAGGMDIVSDAGNITQVLGYFVSWANTIAQFFTGNVVGLLFLVGAVIAMGIGVYKKLLGSKSK